MINCFDLIRKSLLTKDTVNPDWASSSFRPDFEYAVKRFIDSRADGGELGPDQIVLLRQLLRWSQIPHISLGQSRKIAADFEEMLQQSGVDWSQAGHLSTQPYTPSWMPDESCMDELPEQGAADESFIAESYLDSVGYKSWKSSAQKEAVWFCLTAPEGSTRTVVLPTGGGKSLCFQILPRFTPGLTLVIVPTIALAIDQCESAQKIFKDFPDVNPRYYESGEMGHITYADVKERKTRLLFTNPEVCVSGRLRKILDEFSKDGWLNDLVVDEAHLIETWGSQFRVEFQLLAATRQRWLESSNNKLRTFLFSATMSSNCKKILSNLFSEDVNYDEFVCQRLRPEIKYFVQQFDDENARVEAVIESLCHLPRPAILYVTKKADAERYVTTFRQLGFNRLACFHGETSTLDRREILAQWKSGALDLVVATSAFGVGVDKQDVRTVIHACFPENLDRYYQEVGRGGRDGYTSISLLLVGPSDRKTAGGITGKLLLASTIQERWVGLFENRRRDDNCKNNEYLLPTDARYGHILSTRTYSWHIGHNKALLLQLERANLIEILDIEVQKSEGDITVYREWVKVRIIGFSPNTPDLAGLISEERDREQRYFSEGLVKIDEFIKSDKCSARLIAKLYEIKSNQRSCPGCPKCRREGRIIIQAEKLEYPIERGHSSRNFKSQWVEQLPGLEVSSRFKLVDVINDCVKSKGLRHFICVTADYKVLSECFDAALGRNTVKFYRLDDFSRVTSFSCATVFPVVFFHFNGVNENLVRFGNSFPSIHLFSGSLDCCERNVVTNYDLKKYPLLSDWLK